MKGGLNMEFWEVTSEEIYWNEQYINEMMESEEKDND